MKIKLSQLQSIQQKIDMQRLMTPESKQRILSQNRFDNNSNREYASRAGSQIMSPKNMSIQRPPMHGKKLTMQINPNVSNFSTSLTQQAG
jgi:hypothetical protein